MKRTRGKTRSGLFDYKARGRRVWGCDYRDPATRKRKRKVGFRTKALAVEWLAKTDRQELGLEPLQAEPGILVKDGIHRYMEHRLAEGRRASSYEYLRRPEPSKRWKAERRKPKPTWEDELGDMPIRSVTSEMIETVLQKWTAERGLSPASRNNAGAQFSGCLSYAYGRKWIDAHPMEKGRVPKLAVDNGRIRWLRVHEVEAIREKSPDWMKPILTFTLKTGMRLSEVCSLTRASFERDNQGLAYLVTETTKNGQRLAWPLEGWCLDHVEARVKEMKFPADRIFPGPEGGNAETAIKRALPKAVDAAGLRYGRKHQDGVTFHTLRHSMASAAINAGIPEAVVQRMGNWRDRRMLARYAHLSDETLRAGVAKLDAETSPKAKKSTVAAPAPAHAEIGRA